MKEIKTWPIYLIICCFLFSGCSFLFAKDNQETLSKIRALCQNNEFEQAKKVADDYLKEYPQSSEGFILRGKIAYSLKEEDPAKFFRELENWKTDLFPILEEYIKDQDARVRVQAYMLLGNTNDSRRVDIFLRKIKSEADDAAALAIILGMGKCDDPRINSFLEDMLIYPPLPRIKREAVIRAYAKIAARQGSSEMFEKLAADFENVIGTDSTWDLMLESAVKIGTEHPQIIINYLKAKAKALKPEDIDPYLGSTYSTISKAAYLTGKPMTPALRQMYQEEQGNIKYLALRLLIRISNDPEIPEFLIAQLESSDETVKRISLLGLDFFDTEATNNAASKFLTTDEYRATALRVLATKKNIQQLESQIAPFLEDPYYLNRAAAAFALITINPQKYAPRFSELLQNDPEPPVQIVAVAGLGKSGNSDYVLPLSKKLNEPGSPYKLRRRIIDVLRDEFLAQVVEERNGFYKVIPHTAAKKTN